MICDTVQAVSVDLLELLHVGGVHPQLPQQRPRLLQHAGPVHQAGQRDPALQVNVVIKLRNVITRLSSLVFPRPHLYFVVECDVHKGGSCDARPHGVQTSREGGDTLFKLEPDIFFEFIIF